MLSSTDNVVSRTALPFFMVGSHREAVIKNAGQMYGDTLATELTVLIIYCSIQVQVLFRKTLLILPSFCGVCCPLLGCYNYKAQSLH